MDIRERSLISMVFWLVIAVFADFSFADIDPNLVRWWRFDDGGGTTAEDSAGWADGTLLGDPVWTTGVRGGALEFDGDGDYVRIFMRNTSFGTVSIALWIKTDTGQLGVMALDGSETFHIEVTAQGYLAVDVNGVDIVNYENVGDGKWHHIAIVRELDTPEHELAIYIDGDKGATSQAEQTPFALGEIIIGWHNILGGNFFDGLIDDVRIYDAALTQAQIDDLARCAILPSPQDGEIGVSVDTQLSWTPGSGALSHDVYFGTESPPTTLIGDGILDATIDPGPLEYEVTYYWRVDENTAAGTITGDEWSFRTPPWPGSGDANDPYRISDVGQFVSFSEQSYYWGDCFILTADINIPPEILIDPIGNYPKEFSGTFDGRGHIISGFTWDTSGNHWCYNNIGLFSKTDAAAQIKNLGLLGANITSDGLNRAGLLVAKNAGTIANCYSSGSVSAVRDDMASTYVGGLVGLNEGTITKCFSTAAVSGSREQVTVFGGLVGKNEGEISNCYSTGDVSGSDSSWWISLSSSLGGLTGMNDGEIADCYSTGSVYARGDGVYSIGGSVGANRGMMTNCYSIGTVYTYGNTVGGLVGSNSGTVTASFWDTETSGKTNSAAGTGKTTEEMMQQATFGWLWDFASVWRIAEGKTYPHLRIEPGMEGDVDGDGDVDFDDFARMAGNWMVGVE